MKGLSLDQVFIIQHVKLGALLCSLLFLIWGFFQTGQPTTNNGQLCYILLDGSQSMGVQDSPEKSSRLDFSKSTIKSIVDKSPSKRGVSLFAGETQIISPITSDHTTFMSLMAGVDHHSIQKQGSDILGALQQTIHRFTTGNEQKTLILFSDGSDTNLQLPVELINHYKNLQIKFIVIGIGTEQGGPIVLGKDVFGNAQYRLYQGKPVIANLNQTTLQSLATQLGGIYIHVKSNEDISKIISLIHTGEKPINIRRVFSFLSLLCYLLAEYMLLGQKK